MITDSGLFMRRRVRVQTKMMYEQQKFNLLREESEGFAKIATELLTGKVTPNNVETIFTNIQSLIGFFDLDPNRVLDLVLEAFENDVVIETFTTLIGYFNNQALPQFSGSKLAPENESST